jgi:hypothetical protein
LDILSHYFDTKVCSHLDIGKINKITSHHLLVRFMNLSLHSFFGSLLLSYSFIVLRYKIVLYVCIIFSSLHCQNVYEMLGWKSDFSNYEKPSVLTLSCQPHHRLRQKCSLEPKSSRPAWYSVSKNKNNPKNSDKVSWFSGRKLTTIKCCQMIPFPVSIICLLYVLFIHLFTC